MTPTFCLDIINHEVGGPAPGGDGVLKTPMEVPIVAINPEQTVGGDYVVIKALQDGVTIIGLTRGKDTKFHHSEKLDRGEVMIAQFTEHTSAIKIRGRAEVLTKHGRIESGS